MYTNDDIDQLKRGKICSNCIGEEFLKVQVSQKGKRKTCTYCNEKGKCYSIGELSELIETAFKQHYHLTSPDPTGYESAMIKECNEDWDRHGEPVIYAIMNAADIPEEAASDIQKILEEKFYDVDAMKIHEGNL